MLKRYSTNSRRSKEILQNRKLFNDNKGRLRRQKKPMQITWYDQNIHKCPLIVKMLHFYVNSNSVETSRLRVENQRLSFSHTALSNAHLYAHDYLPDIHMQVLVSQQPTCTNGDDPSKMQIIISILTFDFKFPITRTEYTSIIIMSRSTF